MLKRAPDDETATGVENVGAHLAALAAPWRFSLRAPLAKAHDPQPDVPVEAAGEAPGSAAVAHAASKARAMTIPDCP